MAELEASIGQVFAKLIEAIFLGPACDPRNGLHMPHPVTSMDAMLYLDLGGFVQDGLARKQTFNIRGASGDKFCMLCSNIRAISLDLPPDTPEEDIPGSHVTKLANFIPPTDQEVLDAFQVCKEKSTRLSKKQFELREKVCGITFSHHALLLNQTLLDSHLLKPISGYIHDWMHTMASQGVIQRSIWLLLSQLGMWDQLEQFLQLWALPKAMAKAGNLHDLFQAKRTKFYKENSKFKCTASEAISLSTMLAYLVKSICVPAAAHLDQCHSFLAMVEALGMLQATQLGQVQPPMLQHLGNKVCTCLLLFASSICSFKACFHAYKYDVRQAIENALDPFKEANGEAMMLRKHHWMPHLAIHMQLCGFLPNCWSLERKHKTIMMFANQTKKLTGFSLSLLEECLAHDLHNLQHSYHLEAGVQLLNRHAPSSKFHDFLCAAIPQQQFAKDQVWTATSAKLHHGASIHNKDFVLVSSTNAYKWQVARMNTTLGPKGLCTPL